VTKEKSMKRKYDRSGPDVNGWKVSAQMANESAYHSPRFKRDCEATDTVPTTRQASKYARRMGKAYKGVI
jgi:hypothetical protein